MSCERASPLLYDLLDREIERDDAIWLALHLAECRSCAEQMTRLQAAEAFYAAEIPVEPPVGLVHRTLDSVWSHRPAPRSDLGWIAAAVLGVAACILLGLGIPDLVSAWSASAWRGGIQELALRINGLTHLWDAASGSWSSLESALSRAASFSNLPAAVAALLALQISGSAMLLLPGRWKRRTEKTR